HGFGRSVGRNGIDPGAGGGVAVVRGADHGDLAEPAGLDRLAGLALQHGAHAVAAHLHDAAGGAGGGGDLDPFRAAESERLLAVDVFARVQGVQHHAAVPVVGCGDHD